MTARISRFRKKRYVALALVFFAYTAFFTFVITTVGRDTSVYSDGVSDQVDGRAKDVTCERNWYVLGATWSCRATVVTPEGGRHPYSSFANAMSPDDIGKDVAMVAYKTRRGEKTPYFYPARVPERNKFGFAVGFFGSVFMALGSAVALWPRRPKAETASATDEPRK